MFDLLEPGTAPGSVCDDPASRIPLERLEAEICELAGHLAAATCRFLVRLGEFDARRGWASWEMSSCAAWLSWKCQMSSRTAREQVRVARALRDLPVIRAEFGAGRLSYAKVRALTRIATPETEAGLAEIAGPMTGNQLERFARAHRQVSCADDAAARVRRRLAWRFEDDGSLAGTFRLPPLAGAVLLKALRAAAGDLEHPHAADSERPPDGPDRGGSAEPPTGDQVPAGDQSAQMTSSSLADALLVMAEAFLAEKAAAADDPEVYQVIVHVGTDAIASDRPAADAGDVAATPKLPSAAAGAPCGPGAVSRRGRPGHLRDHGADDRLLGVAGPGCCTTAPGSCWTWAVGGGGRTRHCAGRPENGTSAGAGSRAVSPAGSTCTTSSTGPTAAARN